MVNSESFFDEEHPCVKQNVQNRASVFYDNVINPESTTAFNILLQYSSHLDVSEAWVSSIYN